MKKYCEMESIIIMKKTLENRQKELIKKICLESKIDIQNLHTIAGVDLAYWKQNNKEYACCCIVILEFEKLSIIEKKYSIGEITVPYIPGCLAFREYDLVERTVQLLENKVLEWQNLFSNLLMLIILI